MGVINFDLTLQYSYLKAWWDLAVAQKSLLSLPHLGWYFNIQEQMESIVQSYQMISLAELPDQYVKA